MMLAQVLDEDPRPPRQLDDRIPRDIETVCLKAMSKLPGDRYASAAALADDLGRFLRGEAVLARPIGFLSRLVRRARRRPLVTGLLALLTITVTLGLAGVGWQWNRAELARRWLERSLYIHQVALAERAAADGIRSQADQLLENCPANLRGWEWFHVKNRLIQEPVSLKDNDKPVYGLAFSPDGSCLATAGDDGLIRLRDPATGRERVGAPWPRGLGAPPGLLAERKHARLDGGRRDRPPLECRDRPARSSSARPRRAGLGRGVPS